MQVTPPSWSTVKAALIVLLLAALGRGLGEVVAAFTRSVLGGAAARGSRDTVSDPLLALALEALVLGAIALTFALARLESVTARQLNPWRVAIVVECGVLIAGWVAVSIAPTQLVLGRGVGLLVGAVVIVRWRFAAFARAGSGASPDEPESPPERAGWAELGIDRLAFWLSIATLLHVACIVVFWTTLIRGGPKQLGDIAAWSMIPIYPVAIGLAYEIQRRLHRAGLARHRSWQVLVGAVVLNPCAFGWWIPVSVLVMVGGAKRRAEAPLGGGSK
jgi:hypothetical protein